MGFFTIYFSTKIIISLRQLWKLLRKFRYEMEESENDERRDNVNEAIHDRGGGDEPEEDVQTARPNATCDPDDVSFRYIFRKSSSSRFVFVLREPASVILFLQRLASTFCSIVVLLLFLLSFLFLFILYLGDKRGRLRAACRKKTGLWG